MNLRGGRSHLKYIETRLKDKAFKTSKAFKSEDNEFINIVRTMIAQGSIAKKTAQLIHKELELTVEPLEILGILRKNIRSIAMEESKSEKNQNEKEVILSGYLTNP